MTASAAIYRGMNRAELDAAYNNSEAVIDSPQWLARWRERSERMRDTPGMHLDVPYGPRPRQRLDYFPCTFHNAPLFVFIHGGYWQRNDKDMFAFLAEGLLSHDIDVALIGYTLAPEASLTEIVGEIDQALSCMCTPDFPFDKSRLYVGGWSAGGHLTAMASLHPAVRAGLPISGIFDLEPIALNYLNEKLKLRADEIAQLSPLRRLPEFTKPLRLVVGGRELPELRRQSETFAREALARGLPVQITVLPGHHHFSILDELASPHGALTRELLTLIADR